ncbi:integrase [Aureimonas sp. Leaf324]|uniref:integrase n=1 Tax=Aureimonas sp. Leaf324 TaxID=1736336 RepID=UPI000AABC3CC|nr:integrase [Aureimonas sp. Leaf324]
MGAKRALKPKAWAIGFRLDHHGRLRDRALPDLAIDSRLSRCDVVEETIGALVPEGHVRARAMVVQRKTKRPVRFELFDAARTSHRARRERRSGTVDGSAVPSRIAHFPQLGTWQSARLVDGWRTAIGLRKDDGPHSLRRRKASIIDRTIGNRRAVQILHGHTNVQNAVHDLGDDVEDAMTLARRPEVCPSPSTPSVRPERQHPKSRPPFRRPDGWRRSVIVVARAVPCLS